MKFRLALATAFVCALALSIGGTSASAKYVGTGVHVSHATAVAPVASLRMTHARKATPDGSAATIAGYCVVATGPAGDAFVSQGQPAIPGQPDFQALDITAVGLNSDGTNLNIAIQVVSLSDDVTGAKQPQVYGTGDVWEFDFTAPKSSADFVRLYYSAAVDTSNPTNRPIEVIYGHGTVTDGSAKGSLDIADNLVLLSLPLVTYKYVAGDTIKDGNGTSDFYAGNRNAGGNGVRNPSDTGVRNLAAYAIGDAC